MKEVYDRKKEKQRAVCCARPKERAHEGKNKSGSAICESMRRTIPPERVFSAIEIEVRMIHQDLSSSGSRECSRVSSCVGSRKNAWGKDNLEENA